MQAARQRRRQVFIGVLTVLALVLAGPAGSASADPEDDEGGSKNLRQQLEASAKAWSKASVALKKSQKRQSDIEKRMKTVNVDLARLSAEVGEVAAARYKGSQISLMTNLMNARAGKDMLQGAAVAEYLTWRDDAQLRELTTLKREGQAQRDALNAEIHKQEKVFAELDKAKRKAEKALGAAGGMVSAGFTGAVPEAQPAKRNANGEFADEDCTVDDPTTSGCLTPRMFHTLNEARLAKFTHHTACFRESSFGEHPLGRACDFAAQTDGFGGIATGDDKTYGDRLAAWGVKNADALGIMYVIWFRQIWMPGTGWRAYDGDGSAAGNHENHVHISML